jgi:uncharacterized protein
MLEILRQFLIENLWLVGQMAPYLTLGFVFAGLLHAFVPRKTVAKHLGKESVGAAFKASLIGVPIPLCSCGVVPTGIGLRKRGASRAAVVSFLISTPQTGVDSIAATYGFFGWIFAIFRPLAAFVSGIVGGIATLLLKRDETDDEHWLKYHIRTEDALEAETTSQNVLQKFMLGMRFAFMELLGDISLWLVLGIAIAAVISMVIPDDFFADSLSNPFLQKLVMMAIGIPLYVCSTASIPIAAVLMTKGITAGSAFVFLMTGPATNAATMLIIYRVMGWRILALYLGSIALLALGFGAGLDLFLAQTGFTVDSAMHHEHMLPTVITWGSAGLLTFFVVLHFMNGLERRITTRRTMTGVNGLDFIVEGMTCSHCVRTVTDTLKNVRGVHKVNVILEGGHTHVEGENLNRDTLVEAVRSAGYGVQDPS